MLIDDRWLHRHFIAGLGVSAAPGAAGVSAGTQGARATASAGSGAIGGTCRPLSSCYSSFHTPL